VSDREAPHRRPQYLRVSVQDRPKDQIGVNECEHTGEAAGRLFHTIASGPKPHLPNTLTILRFETNAYTTAEMILAKASKDLQNTANLIYAHSL
jgi:hypothetical protein